MKRWLFGGMLLALGCVPTEPDSVPSSLTILPADTTVVSGSAIQLELQVHDQNGDLLEVPEWATPVWSSSDKGALTVDPTGSAHPVGGGDVVVTAKLSGLEGVSRIRVNPRLALAAEAAYVSQGISNPFDPVPLVANRPGIFRLFVIHDGVHFYDPPEARIVIRNGSRVLADVVTTQAEPDFLKSLDESSVRFSYNVLLAGDQIQPGLEATVTYDPDDLEAGIDGEETFRFPVHEMPDFEHMLVPVISTAHRSFRSIGWVEQEHEESRAMERTRQIFPIANRIIAKHSPYYTDVDLNAGVGAWARLLNEITVVRRVEGRAHYYYGAISPPNRTGLSGIGWLGSPASVGDIGSTTLAHQLGHNLGLPHAPCGGAPNPDPDYPYFGGSIGQWGWDALSGRLASPDWYKDIMGYCYYTWISDYNYRKALEFRLDADPDSGSPESVLMLWGGVDGEDGAYLEPAFRIDAPASAPSSGPYLLEGLGPDGRTVFSHRFTPQEVDHSDGILFNVAVPYDRERDGALAEVVFSGPGGTATLAAGSTPAMAIIIDSSTGEVQAMNRNWTGRGGPPGTDVLVSDGLPTEVR